MTFTPDNTGYIRHWLVIPEHTAPYEGEPGSEPDLRKSIVEPVGPAPTNPTLGSQGPYDHVWQFYDPARIKSIDSSRALALPGVRAVVTSADFPQPSGKVADLGEGAMANPRWITNNCMASDKALYKGHAVAAVAATSLHLAEEALSLIELAEEG